MAQRNRAPLAGMVGNCDPKTQGMGRFGACFDHGAAVRDRSRPLPVGSSGAGSATEAGRQGGRYLRRELTVALARSLRFGGGRLGLGQACHGGCSFGGLHRI